MTYDNVNELLALCSIEGTVKIVENPLQKNKSKELMPTDYRNEAIYTSPPDSGDVQTIFFYGTQGCFVFVHQTTLSFFHLDSTKPTTTLTNIEYR